MVCQPSVFRETLRGWPTGVAVVTTVDRRGLPVGLTVNSFTSLSLDPPLVLWCLRAGSASHPAFAAAGHFAVNVLAADQDDVARRFAGPAHRRFPGLAWTPGPYGVPIVDGAAALLVCRRHNEITSGDHVILIGLAEQAWRSSVAPLLFLDGRFTGAPVAAPDPRPVP